MDSIGYANAVGGVPVNNGRVLRQLSAVSLAGATASRPLGARSGVRPGTSTATVTANSTTWSCGPFAGVADVMVAAESGPYLFAFDALTSGAMTAADGSNPRVDIVYVKVTDPENGSTVPKVERLYLAGAAAATPTAPAAPAGGFTIANINVPKAGGGAPTVSWVAPYAVAAGGVLPIDTLANLNLLTGAPGQHATVYADPSPINNGDYTWTGAAWWLDSKPPTAYTPTITGLSAGGTRAFKSWVAAGEVQVSGQVSGILWSAVTGPLTLSVPRGVIDTSVGTLLGRGMLVDASTGVLFDLTIRNNDGSSVIVERIDTSGANATMKPLNGITLPGTDGVVLVFGFRYLPVAS